MVTQTMMASEEVKKAIDLISALGRNEDTQLAHVTPKEMAVLKKMGGSGGTNPITGLTEFFDGDVDDPGEDAGVDTGVAEGAESVGADVSESTAEEPGVTSAGAAPGTGGTGLDLDFSELGITDPQGNVIGDEATIGSAIQGIIDIARGTNLDEANQMALNAINLALPATVARGLAATLGTLGQALGLPGEDAPAGEPSSDEGEFGGPGIKDLSAQDQQKQPLTEDDAVSIFDTVFNKVLEDQIFQFAPQPDFELLDPTFGADFGKDR